MAKKVYRVVACIGRKRNIIFESTPFNTTGGRYHHIGKNIDGGKIEIFLYSKR